jgi:5'-nucleotidase/UDP-sugar diphosphatase
MHPGGAIAWRSLSNLYLEGMNMRRPTRYVSVSIVFFICLATGTILMAQGTVITLLHVNDTHSHLDAGGPKDASLNGTVGGMAKAATIIGMNRALDRNVLLLHAGDVFHGDLFFNKYLGIPEFQLMKQLGFDAMAVGNHEFDLGPEALAYALNTAYGSDPLPLLSANLDLSGFPALATWIQPSLIKTVGGLKIGIFGMTVPGVPTSRPDPVKILGADSAECLMAIAADQVTNLRNLGSDVVICLSHLGYLYDQAMATRIPGIDIIVGGHDHYEFEQPVSFDNPSGKKTLYVQAGMHYQKIGKMHFSFDNGEVNLLDYHLISVRETVEQAPQVQDAVNQLKAGIVQQYGDVYGSPVAFALGDITMANDPSQMARDSGMGNLITDALRSRTGTDLAITANGLISEGIVNGLAMGADIFRPVSFGYDPETGLGLKIATFKMTGLELIKGLEIGLAFLGINEDYFLQVSGLRFAYDPTKPIGQRVLPKYMFVNDQPINPAKAYSVTVNAGLAALLPQMGLQVMELQLLPDLEYTVLRDFIARHPILYYQPQYRILELGMPLRLFSALSALR